MSEYVYEELLHQFQTNIYQPGSKLPSEQKLAIDFHVSRPIVRAALSQLRDNGYIVSKKGSGSYLARTPSTRLFEPIPIEDFNDLILCYEFRAMLESDIAYFAALRATEFDRVNIENTYRKNKSKFSMAGYEAMISDFDFHLAIAEAAHNHFYYTSLRMLRDELLDGINHHASFFRRQKDVSRMQKDEEHTHILHAILSGNPLFARVQMSAHILSSMQRIMTWAKEIPSRTDVRPRSEHKAGRTPKP